MLKSSGVTLVFVYGTLRRGGVAEHLIDGPRQYAVLADHALYGRTRPYPFAVSQEGSMVHGEVVGVSASQLDELDEYEGTEYRRVELKVDSVEGPVLAHVWVAVQPRPLSESELIPSGDWFDR